MAGFLRLGFFNHARYYTDGFKVVTFSPAARFLESLADYGILLESICASLTVTDNTPEISTSGFAVENNVKFYPLPAWCDIEQQLKKIPFKWREISRTIKAFVESSDILWVRVPTLLLELILNEARLQNKPVVIHIASNLRGLWKSSKHKGLKKIPVRIMSEIIHRRSRKTLLHETVLATGPELVDIFSGEGRNVTPFVDSLVGAPKVINSFKPGTGRLIFVGRVDHGKGLFVTLRALKRIKDIGRRVSLSVVGEGPILETLKKEACVLEVDEMITWRGFIPYGEELDCEYEKNHILLLPSESTEGFPRVILEAWAKGVAVIASNIGGMGRIIRNGIDGILVPPSNDIALANAILQLTDKTELRSEIVRNSYRSLEPWTLQNQSFIAADTLKKAYAKVFGCDFL